MSDHRSHYAAILIRCAGSFAVLIAISHARAQVESDIDYHWQLYKINADGTGLARIAEIPGYECGSPKWSPDGTMIAYDTRPFNLQIFDSQIAVIPADGSRPPKLLCPGGMPCWSPDGTHLVFHTYDNPQKIVVMKADGSGRETLVNHWGSPRWMPDGNRIALIGMNSSLTIFNLADGGERLIVGNAKMPRPGFAVSPNGQNIVYGANDGGLYLATLDLQAMQSSITLLWSFGVCYHASWSPDGKRIVFGWKADPPDKLVQRMNLHQLYVLNLDTNGLPVPLAGQDPARNNTNPDWSPDGKTIIFASQKPSQTP